MGQFAQLPYDVTMEVADAHAWIQQCWVGGRFYEQPMLDYIAEHYQGGTFVDIGASIGNHTVYFARQCAPDMLYAFEPVLECFDHMYRNMILNELQYPGKDNVQLYNVAIGDEHRRGRMEMPLDGNEGMWKFINDGQGPTEMFPLDQYDLQDVRLIKIDVEGCELAVLRGASHTIEKYRPVLFVEAKTMVDLHNILEVLGPPGYYKPTSKFNATPTYELTCREARSAGGD